MHDDSNEDPDFPSGDWKGFYTYGHGERDRMDLLLRFGDGRVTGSGTDPVGFFTVSGGYDSASLEVQWIKSYAGRHDVSYRGFRELESIWGTWQIGVGLRGGFRIWPGGHGFGLEERLTEEVPLPAIEAEPVSVPKTGLRAEEQKPRHSHRMVETP